MNVSPSWSIAQVKAALAGMEGIAPSSIRLIFAGQVLSSDSRSLSDYNVQKESDYNVAHHPVSRNGTRLPRTAPGAD